MTEWVAHIHPDRPRVRRAETVDRFELVRFLAELSPASAHQRFFTGMGGRPPLSLVTSLLTGGASGGALLAHAGGELVGHAMWTRLPRQCATAEIALVVADAHQGQGIGTLLLERLRAEMSRAGVEHVHVVTGGDNRVVLGMIARRSDRVEAAERDGATLTFELPVSAQPSLSWAG